MAVKQIAIYSAGGFGREVAWLVPLGDIEALARAITELLSDMGKANRIGEEGRHMAIERFDERMIFEKVKAEYAALLRAKGLRAPARND